MKNKVIIGSFCKRLLVYLTTFSIVFSCFSMNSTVQADSNVFWHILAISLTASSASNGIGEQQKRNELIEENRVLQAQYNSATTSAEILRIQNQYNENQGKIHDSEQNATTFMNLALLGVLWEGYLWLSSPRSSRAENDNTIDESNVEFALQPDIISKKYEFKVVYKF